MVEGMQDGRWALLSKVHHCMVDGVAATDLMSVMFSDTTGRRRRRVVAGPRALRARACAADAHAPYAGPDRAAAQRSSGAARAARVAALGLGRSLRGTARRDT